MSSSFLIHIFIGLRNTGPSTTVYLRWSMFVMKAIKCRNVEASSVTTKMAEANVELFV